MQTRILPPLPYIRSALFLALALSLSACSSLVPDRSPTDGDAQSLQACIGWFERLDRATDAVDAHDAQYTRIAGFPYLRTDRMLASLRNELPTPARVSVWVEHLRTADLTARARELPRVAASAPEGSLAALLDFDPTPASASIPDPGLDQATVMARTAACGAELAAADLRSPDRVRVLRERAQVPDDYSLAARIAGVYPLASLAAARGVRVWERDARALLESPASVRDEALVSYALPGARRGDPTVARLVRSRRQDALGIYALTDDVRRWLLEEHAPRFLIETLGDHDRIGSLQVGAGLPARFETSAPTLYGRVTQTRTADGNRLQLVYTVWFSERPATSRFDIYAGWLDGLVIRLTLDAHGRVAVVDTIHPCGCYHMFVPTALARERPRPASAGPRDEWRFVPTTLPTPDTHDRLVVTVQSGTHYLAGLRFEPSSVERSRVPGSSANVALQLRDEDELAQGLYASDGLVPGTERSERFLLWPLGVKSAGAMRQWGRHATAFVGRRHFDDPFLIDERFQILDAPGTTTWRAP